LIAENPGSMGLKSGEYGRRNGDLFHAATKYQDSHAADLAQHNNAVWHRMWKDGISILAICNM